MRYTTTEEVLNIIFNDKRELQQTIADFIDFNKDKVDAETMANIRIIQDKINQSSENADYAQIHSNSADLDNDIRIGSLKIHKMESDITIRWVDMINDTNIYDACIYTNLDLKSFNITADTFSVNIYVHIAD